MKKQRKGKAIAVAALIFIGMIILASVVKGALPESASKFSDLIFWGIICVGGGAGSFLSGRYLNK